MTSGHRPLVPTRVRLALRTCRHDRDLLPHKTATQRPIQQRATSGNKNRNNGNSMGLKSTTPATMPPESDLGMTRPIRHTRPRIHRDRTRAITRRCYKINIDILDICSTNVGRPIPTLAIHPSSIADEERARADVGLTLRARMRRAADGGDG